MSVKVNMFCFGVESGDPRVERDIFKTEEKHPLNIYFKNQANNYNSVITSWVHGLCQSVGELMCLYCPYVPELY